MNCPWCPFEGAPRPLHAHLAETHRDEVEFEEQGGRVFYGITCPVCGEGYAHQIKPRGRDPEFVEQFKAQIGLVAFDMLVNHLLVEHDSPGEGDPDDAGGEEAQPAPVAGPSSGTGPAWLIEARRRAAEDRPGAGT